VLIHDDAAGAPKSENYAQDSKKGQGDVRHLDLCGVHVVVHCALDAEVGVGDHHGVAEEENGVAERVGQSAGTDSQRRNGEPVARQQIREEKNS